MLHPDLPETTWFYTIDSATHTATFKANDSNFTVNIPMKNFFGCVGVAPPGGESRLAPCYMSATAIPLKRTAKSRAPGSRCR